MYSSQGLKDQLLSPYSTKCKIIQILKDSDDGVLQMALLGVGISPIV
jgi:hypothetical protein